LWVGLDPTLGHEQRGVRPCLVVGSGEMAKHQRFPLLLVAPLTSTPLSGPLYPLLSPSASSGLRERSCVLLDQLRSVDKRRVVRLLGRASAAELVAVDQALRALLGL
jgi:mRNA interferase MazF